jgi:hypothetical protein
MEIEKARMEIEKNLVVSTAHVTFDDMTLLEALSKEDAPKGLIVYENEYFVLVYVQDPEPDLSHFSESFAKLFKFTRDHEEGFTFLKLDCDADMLDGFETFDW